MNVFIKKCNFFKNSRRSIASILTLCIFFGIAGTYESDAENTSPAVRGYCDGGWIPMTDGNYCAEKLNSIENEIEFGFIRTDSRYRKIIAYLTEHIK